MNIVASTHISRALIKADYISWEKMNVSHNTIHVENNFILLCRIFFFSFIFWLPYLKYTRLKQNLKAARATCIKITLLKVLVLDGRRILYFSFNKIHYKIMASFSFSTNKNFFSISHSTSLYLIYTVNKRIHHYKIHEKDAAKESFLIF